MQSKYQESLQLLQRSLDILEKAYGVNHPEVATNLYNQAATYFFQGNSSKALSLSQRSLEIREKALGLEHPDVARNLRFQARLYQQQGDISRAIALRNRSLDIEERNLEIILAIGSERQKQQYMALLMESTDLAVSGHLQSAPNNPEAARLALTTLLRRKGRILDVLSDSQRLLRQNLTPENQALFDEFAATSSQLAALIFKPPTRGTQDYRKQVASLKTKAEQLEAELSRRSTEFRSATQPATIEAVQKLIPASAALVELVLYKPVSNPKGTTKSDRYGKPHYAAYILQSQGSPQWIDLGEAQAIDQAVANFRTALQSDSSDVKPVARALDEKLMQPIRKLLGNTRTILLSPDSQLNLIPFAALVDESDRYLVENYSINYLSSGRDLLRLPNHALSRSESVIVANPDYDKPGDPTSIQIATNPKTSPPAPPLRGEGSRNNIVPPFPAREGGLGGLGQTDPTRGVLDSDRTQQIEFSPLANTAAEAKAISPMLPGATLLTGSEATENAIKQLFAPNILHIATHGFFLQDVPEVAPPDFSGTILSGTRSAIPNVRPTENPLLRSGLALAGANPRQSGSEDGILTALEAAGLNLSGTKLLVLSACKTGLGDVTNGEGVYGLRRAFAIAGAESQLMSLWAVNDYKTNKLMVDYYQRLKNHVGRSEALRQTQLEMLQNPSSEHPYYWAAFIPSGDWTPMGF
jgi:CHAT domain-containing protein